METNPNANMQMSAAAASPSSVAAFFDMDHTLLRGSSGRLYLQYLLQSGRVSRRQWLVIIFQVTCYMAGRTDFPHLMANLMARATGTSEAEAWRISEAWFETMLRNFIAERGRERVAWHQKQGHHVAIVSAATPFAVEPVARSLGLDYLATRLEVVDGHFTGRLVEPACYGAGKVALAAAYAAERGLTLRGSYFYSDSHEDLPLLEAVGHPIAVNPNRKLARVAAQRAWPIMRFY